MDQKRQSNNFVEDLYSQINKLSLEIAESKKFCDENNSLIDGLQQLEHHNDELLKQSATYEKEIVQLKQENKKLSFELRSCQQYLEQHQQKINEAVELNEQLKEDLHRATQLPRDCHRCADISTLSMSTTKRLQQLESHLEQKTIDHKKATEAGKAKHMEMQRARRVASEERRRLCNENYQLNNAVKEHESKLAIANTNLDKKNKEINQLKNKLHEAKQIETELTNELGSRTDSICFLNAEKSKLSIEVDELSSKLVNTQTAYNLFECSMINDLNASQKDKENHILAIKSGEQTIQAMSRENNMLTKKNESLTTELSEMRKVTCRHRERIASLEGRESVLADMLKVNQDELSDMKDQMHKLTGIITETDAELTAAKKANIYLAQQCAEHTNDYENVNTKFNEFKEKYKQLHCDYELLKEDYLHLSKIKEKAVLALETASNWQAEQKEREKSLNIKFTKQNEHIRTLLEDRQNLLTKIAQMHKDSIIHRSEMRNFIPESDTTPSSRPSQSNRTYYPVTHSYSHQRSRIVRYRSDPTLDQSDDQIMKRLRHTTRSMHRTRKFWQNGIDSVFNGNA